MGMNYKVHIRTVLVDLGMDTLFGRRLNVAVIRKVVDFYKHNIVRRKIIISTAAGGNYKVSITDTTAYISPGPCDKTRLQKPVSCFYDKLFGF